MQISDAYWAGFFDGEGHIGPTRYFSKIHQEKFIIAIRVVVVQKEPMVLYLMQKHFGGKVRIRKNGIGEWSLSTAKDVTKFLLAIRPFLLIKAVELNIALELLEAIVKPRGTLFPKDEHGIKRLHGKAPISLDDIKIRQLLERRFFNDRYNPKSEKPIPINQEAN